jgi:hypothetical protein
MECDGMASPRFYQPLLLRIIHGLSAIIALLAIVTAFLVYNTFDGRLLRLPLPRIDDIIGIHGTFGLTFLLIFPLLAIYSFYAGEKLLVQSNSWSYLTKANRRVRWYSWHRLVNTLMLIAATWALISGRMMKEEWLPTGELDHLWYYGHVSAWLLLVICLSLHLWTIVKVGGIPLIVSIFSWRFQPEDSPRLWWQKINSWLMQLRHK